MNSPSRPSRRQLWRATQLLQRLLQPRPNSASPALPSHLWHDLLQTTRLLQLAQSRGWPAASLKLRRQWRDQLQLLERQCGHLRQWDKPEPGDCLSERELLADLRALEFEFAAFQLDLKQRRLSVITDPICLEDIELGPFELVLEWRNRLSLQSLQVIALEPNPAAGRPDVTHPHVNSRDLCEGEGRQALEQALAQGRLYDFFLLVRQILETYNPSSAYMTLASWQGTECGDCGDRINEEETRPCEACRQDLCDGCSDPCGACGDSLCAECRDRCAECSETHCPGCLQSCVDCGEHCCRSCLQDGRCGPCQADFEEETHFETDEATQVPEENTATPAAV